MGVSRDERRHVRGLRTGPRVDGGGDCPDHAVANHLEAAGIAPEENGTAAGVGPAPVSRLATNHTIPEALNIWYLFRF